MDKKVLEFVQILTISTFFPTFFCIQGNLFHNKYSHVSFVDILLLKIFPVWNFLTVINLKANLQSFTIIL